MALPLPTICCSALALALLACTTAASEKPELQLSFFPVRLVWTLPLSGTLTAPPAFSRSSAYLPVADDHFAAYDLLSGTQLWMVSARPLSRPAVGEGLIFLVEPDGLSAIRQTDGSVAWRLPFAEALAVPLVWDNGWLIAAAESGSLLAFRARDGELIWRRDLGAVITAPPALAADRVYVPIADRRLIALRVDTGAPVWERRLGGRLNDILALEDRLYVGADDNYFYCVKAETGEVDWRWRTGGDVIGLPIVDNHRVYFVSLDNVLRALDRRRGTQQWKRAMPLRPVAGPTIVADAVIVSGTAPPLRGYALQNGAPAGDVEVAGEIVAASHVVDGVNLPTIVVVTRDIAKGDTMTAITRSIEPTVRPIGPLPGIEAPMPRPTPTPQP